jgi:drug/metabolite transporter (DMT)-like permease
MIDRYTLLGLTAILLWSTTVAFSRSISEHVGPLLSGASVYLAAGLILACQLVIKDRSLKRLRTLPPKYLFGCGALFVICNLALYLGLGLASNRYQTIEVGLVNYLWPSLTILLSLPILARRASLGLIPGTLVAFFGVYLVMTMGTWISWGSFSANLLSNPRAYGLGIVAAVSWALYSNLARRWGGPGSDGAVVVFVLATGVAFLALLPLHPAHGSLTPRVVGEIGYLGLATAVAYVSWDTAMRKGDVVLVAACSYLTPFFSTVVSSFYLGVLPGLSLWLGCVLIIAGSFLSWHSMERPKRAALKAQ